MGITSFTGPLVIHGPSASTGVSGQNVTTLPLVPESGPSPIFAGVTLFDPRYPYKGGGGTENSALLALGVGLNGGYLTLDQAPSVVTTTNIAVAAAATSGTNMTLVSASGAGITVLAAALQIPQTGNTVPTGSLAIDLAPALVFFGTTKNTAVADPTKNIARAVAITATSGAAGGAFLVSGRDLYGYPQTEKITVASSPSGSTTTNGKKAFKFINTVTPQVTDAKSYSVGTSDIYGFPVRSDKLAYATITWAGSPITVSTGFVAADTTSPATNTTGDVRGTYNVQSASDGTKSLQLFQDVSPANVVTITGLFGVTPA
jgi:hypothetical protein